MAVIPVANVVICELILSSCVLQWLGFVGLIKAGKYNKEVNDHG